MTRIKLDRLLCLDINHLVKNQTIVKQAQTQGVLSWQNKHGVKTSELEYRACIDIHADNCGLRLKYFIAGKAYNERIAIEATPQPFGGKRLWFICPDTKKRVSKLYLINGKFLSRHVYPSAYDTQSMCPINRAIHRKHKIGRKMDNGYDGWFPSKQKGMHYKTYRRLNAEFIKQDDLFYKLMNTRFGDLAMQLL